VIGHPSFETHPWLIRETGLDLERLAQTESLFALSNGHVGLRGNLDEGEPHGMPGTYLNGLYETHPIAYGESAYGNPEDGQSVVDVTNGKLIRLLLEDEPFDVRYGELLSHERVLDLRAGTLRREAHWRSPRGQTVVVRSLRLVSLVERAIAAIEYEVECGESSARVVVQSELVANEALPRPDERDPRVAAVPASPLRGEHAAHRGTQATLVHVTRGSGLRLGAAMDHEIEGPDGMEVTTLAEEDLARVTVACVLEPGQRLRIIKLLGYGWSRTRSLPAVIDQVEGALAGARQTGWGGLLATQREWLDDFWSRADIELDGDPQVQQGLRFGMFHTVQAGVRAERRAIPAKGLTGPGYDGHAFWDTETFVLPLLTYTAPNAAAQALRWRHSTLALARERARLLGLAGAAFPWRTIQGEECSSYWPAGTAAFHVNADIADAVIRYLDATDDDEFARDVGLELLVETARLWASLGHHSKDGFRIDGVTGPDEYSAIADNNIYTNLMAQRNLSEAAALADRLPEQAAALEVTEQELTAWRAAADAMIVPFDDELGVHSQAEGFTRHERWDFDSTPPEHYPLLLHYQYFELYRSQVVKQADLVLALLMRGDAFTPEQKRRAFEYYEPLTVRDSSLSACIQGVIAAEIGQLELAHDYFAEAALMDIDDLEHNVRDGVHIASLAGAWIVAVAGFGGMRDFGGEYSFEPRLPEALGRLCFHVLIQGRRLRVEVWPERARYQVVSGPALELTHHGETITVAPDSPEERAIPASPPRERTRQPPGREPRRRAEDESA
jgi:alpha,alpha-trehalose phosphorylase